MRKEEKEEERKERIEQGIEIFKHMGIEFLYSWISEESETQKPGFAFKLLKELDLDIGDYAYYLVRRYKGEAGEVIHKYINTMSI